jgi:hypothetical protein
VKDLLYLPFKTSAERRSANAANFQVNSLAGNCRSFAALRMTAVCFYAEGPLTLVR